MECMLTNIVAPVVITDITRKMVPITGRASSFLDFFCMYVHVRFQKQSRKEKEEEIEQQQTYQFIAR